MFEGHDHVIRDLLAGCRLVGPAQLDAVLAEHGAGGKSLASVVVEHGVVDKPTLLRVVAQHLGCDYCAELPATLPAAVAGLVTADLARTYGVAPLAGDDLSVSIAAVDPFNPHLASDLAFALQRPVRIIVADPEKVRLLVRQHYGGEEGSRDAGLDTLSTPAGDPVQQADLSTADIEQLAGQTPIIRLVNQVLAQAIRAQASDIHFEPFEHEFKIRSRIDGALQEAAPAAKSLALPVVSRLKVLASLNIAERRLPQDGRLKLNLGGRAVDLRISTLPTQFGESVVLRVLDQASGHLELGQLGLPEAIGDGVRDIIRRPNGIFIVTGPTGSGKTTTLYSCLKELNTADSKLLTVEDPVEYEIDGVMQVPVNLAAGLTFARALRSFLRQDPDIVMVGEIRDSETARIAIQAALTGHLVLSTLHTNDAPAAVTRLVDMGIEPFLLASTLEGVLAQRLVRRVCLSCKTAFKPPEALLRQLGLQPEALNGRPLYSGKGCAACLNTGYKGRLGIFEFLRMSEPVREMVVRGASLVQLRQQVMGEGMTPLRDAGLQAVLAGETTVEEVARYT